MAARRELAHRGAILAFLWMGGVSLGLPAAVTAQVHVDADTRVRSIRFTGTKVVRESALRDIIETRALGATFGLRMAFGKLPFVPPPTPPDFSPVTLQQDLIRLRRHYQEAGFLGARVRYDVRRDESRNLLDIAFVIEEGTPTRVGQVAIVGPDSLTSLTVPDSLTKSWRRVEASAQALRGQRLRIRRVQAEVERIQAWWLDHGHPSVGVHEVVDVDSAMHEARVRLVVSPGSSARFGPITINGESSISERAIRRELPFQTGDPYSASALNEGRSELQEFGIIRNASFEISPLVPSAYPPGFDVPVRVDLNEAKPRRVGGDVGYGSDAGISTQARWEHRNFLGEGRILTVSAAAQTGLLAIAADPDVRYGGSVSLLQPYLLHRRLSGVLSPSVEERDDNRDRSLEVATNATLILRTSAQRTVSLDYRIARRRIYEYRLENLTGGGIDLLTFLQRISEGFFDSLGTTLETSTWTLSGRLGTLDQPADPHRGLLFRPTAQVTAPPGPSSTEYWRLDGAAFGFVPLKRRVVFAARAGFGRIFPFGKSLPGPGEDPTLKFLQLRDALQTAGGSGDVRGWSSRLLGPKLPDIRAHQIGDSLFFDSEGYTPLGGFSRATFSAEIRLPLPGFGDHLGSHFFLDGGRVWTSDHRFSSGDDPTGQEKWFYATGAGLDVHTPVGPVSVSLAYKLNPSFTDLADAGDYFHAILDGTPVDQLKQRNSRRWQLHLTFGSAL